MVLRNLAKAAVGAVLGSAIAERSAGRGLLGAGLGVVATRLATRSVPGALLVGGAFVAKKLYDQRKEHKAISPSDNSQSLPPATPSRSRLAKPTSER